MLAICRSCSSTCCAFKAKQNLGSSYMSLIAALNVVHTLIELHCMRVVCLQVPCDDVPNSTPTEKGSCACTNPPFTIPAMQGSLLRQCLSTEVVVSSCPEEYATAVRPQSGMIMTCITDTTPCPSKFMPFYSGSPIKRESCQPEQQSCTTSGFTVALADVRPLYTPRRRSSAEPRQESWMPQTQDRSCLGTKFGRCTKGRDRGGLKFNSLLSGMNYLDEVLGCVSDAATRCPVGYVGFMSASKAGSKDFKLELCTKTSTCYSGASGFNVQPAKYASYTTLGLDADETFVACLRLDGGACPALFPKNATTDDSKECSV